MTPHRGFALAELLVSVLLIAIVGGAIASALQRQQQLFRSIAVMVSTRGDVRDAAEVLAADLSSVSPVDTLPLAADSAIEFLGLIGTSISCHPAPGYVIRLPPEKIHSGYRLTTLLAAPDSGDVLLVLNHDSAATAGEPRWERHVIAAVSSASASSVCPSTTGFTTAADQTAPSYAVTLSGAVSDGVSSGAPVRILRRTRYSLYRSSDSRWYLGQRRCDPLGPSSCRPIQPVSGPYAGYSSAGWSGVSFGYFDAAGTALTPWEAGSRVARIGVVVRGRSQALPRFGRSSTGDYADSSATAVALRNRD